MAGGKALPPLVVARVRNGFGLVATRRFERGERIDEIRGRIVTPARLWRYWDSDPQRAANCIRFDAEHYLDPRGEIGQFANHSCDPNAALLREGPRLVLRALKICRPGDEITHDYATLLGADDIWRMRCNCGERRCRGVVSNVASLPAPLFARYRKQGLIAAFILATLRDATSS
ncbi:MAG: SET domain-containing protein [Steroidobacteraceae bacterium]